MNLWVARLSVVVVLGISGCATRQKVYEPPNPAQLKASTGRVSVAVDSAHKHARTAQQGVTEAQAITKEVDQGLKKLTDVPPELYQRVNDLESKLVETHDTQALLEKDLVDADQAKAQVEKDKTDYFAGAQKLADDATQERDKRIKAEQSLHWYRVHFFLGWVLLITGVVACILFALVKFGLITWFKIP